MQAGGTWQEFSTWPPPDSRPVQYYLEPNLSLTTEAAASGAITYTFDPSNPVPTIGGRVSSGQPVLAGPYDQRCTVELPQL